MDSYAMKCVLPIILLVLQILNHHVLAEDPKKLSSYGPLYAPDCGFSRASHPRSPNAQGYKADLHAYAWMAALGYQSSPQEPLKWMCAGSLISARHILTSAQCVHERNDLKMVRLGDRDLYNDTDDAQSIDVPVERVTVHPYYKNADGNVVNDIAVVRLQNDVSFNFAVRPICLPLNDDLKNKNFTKHHPIIAGWGSLQPDGVAKHPLAEFWYPVLTTKACQKVVTGGFRNQNIDERVLCTGYLNGDENVCLTDKGGPLMYPVKNLYLHVIGVLSSSVECEHNRYPRVYTRVSEYLDFITDNLH